MINRFLPVLGLVALCWAVFLMNNLLWGGSLNPYGIVPRHFGSLPAIIWAPVLHGSYAHLAANTVPLLVLGGILCARSKSEFGMVLLSGALLGGGLTWTFARHGSHIGASILVFTMFGYLASLAWFRRTLGTLLLSGVCVLGYGGILRGILPSSAAVSWEGHAAGLIAGIVLAWVSSKLLPPDQGAGNDLVVLRRSIEGLHSRADRM